MKFGDSEAWTVFPALLTYTIYPKKQNMGEKIMEK